MSVEETMYNPELPDGLSYSEGLTEKQIDQLVQFSNDPKDEAIKSNTSDPERFKDKEAVENWLQKRRSIYTLTNDQGDLLGMSWLGAGAMPQGEFTEDFGSSKYGVTFAIRLYGEARGSGKGLSRQLTKHAIGQYKQTTEYQGLTDKGQDGIWLEVSQSNGPGVALYEKSGFTPVTNPNEKGKMFMILPRN